MFLRQQLEQRLFAAHLAVNGGAGEPGLAG